MLNKVYSKVTRRPKRTGSSVLSSLRQTCLAASLLPSVVFATPAFAEELNSERIERRFGSYAVQVLEESTRLRVSSLNSRETSGPTCRTFAVVRYASVTRPPSLQMAHRKILNGGSIGATLAASGWAVEKTTRYLGDIALSADDRRVRELMRLDADQNLALHIYDLHGSRDRQKIPYATIVEIHHPDYLSKSELASIYDRAVNVPLSDAERRDLLALTREKMRSAGSEKVAILLNL